MADISMDDPLLANVAQLICTKNGLGSYLSDFTDDSMLMEQLGIEPTLVTDDCRQKLLDENSDITTLMPASPNYNTITGTTTSNQQNFYTIDTEDIQNGESCTYVTPLEPLTQPSIVVEPGEPAQEPAVYTVIGDVQMADGAILINAQGSPVSSVQAQPSNQCNSTPSYLDSPLTNTQSHLDSPLTDSQSHLDSPLSTTQSILNSPVRSTQSILNSPVSSTQLHIDSPCSSSESYIDSPISSVQSQPDSLVMEVPNTGRGRGGKRTGRLRQTIVGNADRETPKPRTPRRRRPIKAKKYEMTESLTDPIAEKKRLNAINAKKNRDKKKNMMAKLEETVKQVTEQRDQLLIEVEILRKREQELRNQLHCKFGVI